MHDTHAIDPSSSPEDRRFDERGTPPQSVSFARELLDAARLGVFFALASGVFEGAKFFVDHFLLARVTYDSPHALWLTTVFDLLLLVPLSVGLAVASRLLPIRYRRRTVVFAVAYVAFVAVIGSFGELADYAVLLLALGLAIQTTRMIESRWAAFWRIAARSTVILAVAVGLVAAATFAAIALSDRRALASLPSPPPPGSPNVVLVVLDTVRAKNLSLYGYPIPTTPYLEELARRGVAFDKAISTAPWTGPSHATMFTGKYPNQLSVDWLVPLDSASPAVAEAFRDRGYATGGFVANTAQVTANLGFARGFTKFEDFHLTSAPQFILASAIGRRTFVGLRTLGLHNLPPTYRWNKIGSTVVDDFLEWQAGQPERPFFAFLNFMDAHNPYWPGISSYRGVSIPPAKMRTDPNDPTGALGARSWDRQRNYNARIAYLDGQVRRLVEALERRGLADNTILVVVADHGELFNEHGVWSHGFRGYLELLHVPLVIVAPGRVPVATRVGEFVTLRDLTATIVDLAGLSPSATFPGTSLATYWKGGAPSQSPILSEYSESKSEYVKPPRPKSSSLIDGGYHYIVTSKGKEELYDVSATVDDVVDLAPSPEAAKVLARMRARLEGALTSTR